MTRRQDLDWSGGAQTLRWNITRKFVLLFLAFGLVPMGIVGYVALGGTKLVDKDAADKMIYVAKDIASKIDRNLFERYGDVQAFGLNRVVLQRESWGKPSPQENPIVDMMNKYVDIYGIYYLTIFVDLEGNVVAVNDRDADGKPINTRGLYAKNYKESDWFRAVSAGRFITRMPFTSPENTVSDGTYIEDFHVDEDVKATYSGDDALTLGFSAPVYEGDKVIGYWSNRAKHSLVEDIVVDAFQGLKSAGLGSGEITVLDSQGNVIVDMDPNQHGGKGINHDANVIGKLNLVAKGVEAAKRAVAGESGSMVSAHARKKIEQLAGFTHLTGAMGYPGMNWSVLVRVPSQDAFAASGSLRRSTLLVGAVLIPFLVVFGMWIARRFARPIVMLSDAAADIAEGNLNREIRVNSKDEIGMLASSFQKMVESLGSVLGQVRLSAEQVSNNSAQMTGSGRDLADNATRSAASLQQMSASMERLAGQTRHNADNADQAMRLATSVRDTAKSGDERMVSMVHAMSDIENSAQEISKIIKVIDDIAFQTNLLALNAAVEAARAGVHGKGFAVVAEEVRNLAARSARAASETTEMIENSIEKVSQGTTIAKDTAASLGEIVSGVAKVSDLVSEIAAASSEQAQGFAEVNTGVTEVDEVTQRNTANAEELAASARELSSQSNHLNDVLNRFTLRDSGQTFIGDREPEWSGEDQRAYEG